MEFESMFEFTLEASSRMPLIMVGIVTAALDVTIGGFAPILWFLLAIVIFMIAICTEVLRIADFLESKK